MPSKKRKPKRKQRTIEVEFEIMFDDTTMLEADGKYKEVERIMQKEFMGDRGWVIKSKFTVFSPFGQGNFVIDFYHDKRVYVVGFNSTTPDRYQNPDVRCLTMWCQENGWKIPQVAESVILENHDFWKHMWDTLIIDSNYFDDRYGMRRSLRIDEKINSETEEDEIV